MGGGSFRRWKSLSRTRKLTWCVVFIAALFGGLYVRWRSDQLVARLTGDVERPLNASDGVLVIAGGGMLPHAVKERFWRLAGMQQARIVVIPASRMEPEQQKIYEERWDDFETESVQVLQTDIRAQADDPKFSQALETATGVWLGGGQQTWLTQWYRGTLVQKRMQEVLERGGVIGGTSAGAAVMSDIMIAGGRREPIESRGFGFFPEIVVDQHFLQRNRVGRLWKLLEKHPGLVGLGIDERTALIVELKGRRLSVVGDSYVTACIPVKDGHPIRIEVLKPGDRITLHDLQIPESIPESPWDLDAILVGED